MAIRAFVGSDVNKIGAQHMADLHRAAVKAAAEGRYEPEDIEAWMESITPAYYSKLPPTFNIFTYLDCLHEDDSEYLTGFAVVGTRTGRLTCLYVHPDHWGRGVGRQLLQRCRQWTRHPVESPLGAAGFFESCGLRRVGEGVFDVNARKLPCVRLAWDAEPTAAKRPGSDQDVSAEKTAATRRKV